MDPLVGRFLAYLDASPTPFHAARATQAAIEKAGFQPIEEGSKPQPLEPGQGYYLSRAGSIIAFRVGSQPVQKTGFRILAAHTDSPNLRVKPQPILKSHGYVRLGVDVYGGCIIATWADRDLGMAGRVMLRKGDGPQDVLVDIRRPLCRIPNVAIHLNREVNEKGLILNAQTHLPALFSTDTGVEDPLRDLLSTEIGCKPEDILTWDLSLFDLTPASLSGVHGSFIHSGRLDNLGSCHALTEALLSGGEMPAATQVVALFDHEEVGSVTARGADSRLLDNVLRRISRDATQSAPGGTSRALMNSWLISVDMAHAVHPAYESHHDPSHQPLLNGGPVIKQNVNQRYSTEAETSALFIQLCEAVDVPYQWFINRSDWRCGSTVGPMLASRLGVKSLDVGNPMLSMHSAREMCGSQDQAHMVKALAHFLCAEF